MSGHCYSDRQADGMHPVLIITGVPLAIAALVVAVIAAFSGQWIVALAMAVSAASIGIPLWNEA